MWLRVLNNDLRLVDTKRFISAVHTMRMQSEEISPDVKNAYAVAQITLSQNSTIIELIKRVMSISEIIKQKRSN